MVRRGMQGEAERVKAGPLLLLDMFDSSWRVRSIWDGVRLEVAEEPGPVVLHSFTHLDPDLPLLEVSRVGFWVEGGSGAARYKWPPNFGVRGCLTMFHCLHV